MGKNSLVIAINNIGKRNEPGPSQEYTGVLTKSKEAATAADVPTETRTLQVIGTPQDPAMPTSETPSVSILSHQMDVSKGPQPLSISGSNSHFIGTISINGYGQTYGGQASEVQNRGLNFGIAQLAIAFLCGLLAFVLSWLLIFIHYTPYLWQKPEYSKPECPVGPSSFTINCK